MVEHQTLAETCWHELLSMEAGFFLVLFLFLVFFPLMILYVKAW